MDERLSAADRKQPSYKEMELKMKQMELDQALKMRQMQQDHE